MKILIHRNSHIPLRVNSFPYEEVKLQSTTCSKALWELAAKYPGEVIGWCEEDLEADIVPEKWVNIFRRDLIMSSYALKTTFLPDSIGYVDQLPFINVNRNVKYPTWFMSSDIGGISGNVLLQFHELLGKEDDFGYLLNAVAKVGQQNGLFCYSDPTFLNNRSSFIPLAIASTKDLFQFVYQHYSNFWSLILLFCMWKYENKLPLREFLNAFFNRKKIGKDIDLSSFKPLPVEEVTNESIDVIIPTLGRPESVLEILKSLKNQTLLPKKVIIVEQNPDPESVSHLSEFTSKEWPFKIVHYFIHQTGVCNARNMALKEVSSNWIFFCDDDNRFESDLLWRALKEIKSYEVFAMNTAYGQKEEDKIYENVKQWGAFGAGNAIVNSQVLTNIFFDESFEYGYGEDNDFGMQLRSKGIDIIYHPDVRILHLKAPDGGFRKKLPRRWEVDGAKLLPKPSPTLMIYAIKNFTKQQRIGYKVSLFLKFFLSHPIKNPLKYYHQFIERWNLSEYWAKKIIEEKI